MSKAKQLFDFYINSSIHVSLGVVALTALTCLHFNFELETALLAFVFFGSITAYNFVKYAGIAKLHHRSLAKNLRLLQVFSFFCFLVLCFLTLKMKAEVLWAATFLGFITLLYALPVFYKKRNLRNIAGLKVFVIALIWGGVSVCFPVAEEGFPVQKDVLLEFCQRFLFVLILILPFEIRDLKYDLKSLRTLPQRLGVQNAKKFGYFLISVWVMLEFFQDRATGSSIAAILSAALITGIFIYRSEEDQGPYFSSFWVEGIPILWFVLLWFFEHL